MAQQIIGLIVIIGLSALALYLLIWRPEARGDDPTEHGDGKP